MKNPTLSANRVQPGTMRTVRTAFAVLALMATAPVMVAAESAGERHRLVRKDFHVRGPDGMAIGVREVRAERSPRGRPLLLVHGARVPGVASFDLPVDGGSLAGDLANSGRRVYVVDARGYGASDRPPEMNRPPDASLPLMTGDHVVRDLDAVVDWLDVPAVDLLGWATGGHWAAWYASTRPERVANLVVYNSLYGAVDGHGMLGRGSQFEDPNRPGEFNDALGGYRVSSGPDLLPNWDDSIPVADKTKWHDPRVVAHYQRAALASDPTSDDRTPPSFRAPNGAMKDSFYLATGRQLWDAGAITARTLVLRGEYDFWSREQDVPTLTADLTAAADVRAVTLRHGTHFAHLDRAHRGRTQLLAEVGAWLR
ncbi:Lysophospholipase, alpha-beta hydrolase superfamily [Kibdelosporangium aridum]|uniref:Lysophospholipase, alpha-beta hydrolase superfamily n=2 Tax=Kibdelosporangium aridum TaxID=2030 RepID=A0A1W2AXZ8_KIBAR|nr:Lysophospholipase, alpha-beta hydrolase superfamily [Kibdelosporangium aridum]